MESNSLREQIASMRQSFFDEHILDKHFVQLENLADEDNPNFVEEVITLFFRDSTTLLDNLEQAMKQNDINFAKIDKGFYQLQGSSVSIGAIKVWNEVSKTREFCQLGIMEGAMEAFKELRKEHESLKGKLESYFQLMRQASPAEPAKPGPVVGPDN